MSNDLVLRLLSPRTARWVLLASAVGLALAASVQAGERAATGPGTVFASVEAAAADALRFAAARSTSQRELGGTISRVDGGFSYAAPEAGDRDGVQLRLGREDVAWYYTHGTRDGGREEDRLNEGISQRDRAMVDRVDPAHRPLFVSTPTGRLLRYQGERLAVLSTASLRIAAH